MDSPIITFLLQAGLFTVSLFLILVVLVQRGKGGGLTGALGGAGGASAFGTKAGDVFTKFTVILAVIWILLCLVTIQLRSKPDNSSAKKSSDESGMTTAPDPDSGAEPGVKAEGAETAKPDDGEESPAPPTE